MNCSSSLLPSPVLPSLRDIGLPPFNRGGVYHTPESSPAPPNGSGLRSLPPLVTNRYARGSLQSPPVIARVENMPHLHGTILNPDEILPHPTGAISHLVNNDQLDWQPQRYHASNSDTSPSPDSPTSSEDVPFSPTTGRKRPKAADDTHKRRERKRRAADTLAHKEAVPDLEKAGWSIGTKLKAQNKFSAQGLDFKKEDVLNALVVLVRCYHACMTRAIGTAQEARARIQDRIRTLPEDSDDVQFLKDIDHSHRVIITALQPAFPQEEVHAFTARLYARVERNLCDKEGDSEGHHS